MVGMPPVLSKNRFVQRSRSFTSLSWSELAELSRQKESSNSTALLVSYQQAVPAQQGADGTPRSTAQSHDFVVVLSLSLLYEELLQHSRRKSRVTSATLAGDCTTRLLSLFSATEPPCPSFLLPASQGFARPLPDGARVTLINGSENGGCQGAVGIRGPLSSYQPSFQSPGSVPEHPLVAAGSDEGFRYAGLLSAV